MNSSSSGLMSYCSLAKKNLSFREAVGALFPCFFRLHSPYFGYPYPVGDALTVMPLLALNAHLKISTYACTDYLIRKYKICSFVP